MPRSDRQLAGHRRARPWWSIWAAALAVTATSAFSGRADAAIYWTYNSVSPVGSHEVRGHIGRASLSGRHPNPRFITLKRKVMPYGVAVNRRHIDGQYGDGDSLTGGPGRDQLSGGDGPDRLDPGTGRDMLSCGSGTDRISGPERRELLKPDCEWLGFAIKGGSLSFPAYPVASTSSSVSFRMSCPDLDILDGEPASCDGPLTLREASGSQPVLGRGRIRDNGTRYSWTVRVRLTDLGRQRAKRPRGVLATISISGRNLPRAAWTIRLTTAS